MRLQVVADINFIILVYNSPKIKSVASKKSRDTLELRLVHASRADVTAYTPATRSFTIYKQLLPVFPGTDIHVSIYMCNSEHVNDLLMKKLIYAKH